MPMRRSVNETKARDPCNNRLHFHAANDN